MHNGSGMGDNWRTGGCKIQVLQYLISGGCCGRAGVVE